MIAPVVVARLLLAGVFAVAAVAKLRRQHALQEALAEIVPLRLVTSAAVFVALVELAVAAALVAPQTATVAALAALVLLALFTTFIGLRGDAAAACGCFGSSTALAGGRLPFLRNGLLAVPAAGIAWSGGAGLPGAAAALVAAATGGVAVATTARRRSVLRTLDGAEIELRSRDRTLLVFWTPTCPPCRQLLPDLNRWHDERPAERPAVVVVSRGSVAENRGAGLQPPIVLDNLLRTMHAFGVAGRPAVLLLEGDRPASGPVYGVPGIRRFLDDVRNET